MASGVSFVSFCENGIATHLPQQDPSRSARIPLQGLRAWVLNSHGPQIQKYLK